eukprot:1610882-Rhodomonas_salina.2
MATEMLEVSLAPSVQCAALNFLAQCCLNPVTRPAAVQVASLARAALRVHTLLHLLRQHTPFSLASPLARKSSSPLEAFAGQESSPQLPRGPPVSPPSSPQAADVRQLTDDEWGGRVVQGVLDLLRVALARGVPGSVDLKAWSRATQRLCQGEVMEAVLGCLLRGGEQLAAAAAAVLHSCARNRSLHPR